MPQALFSPLFLSTRRTTPLAREYLSAPRGPRLIRFPFAPPSLHAFAFFLTVWSLTARAPGKKVCCRRFAEKKDALSFSCRLLPCFPVAMFKLLRDYSPET